MGFRSDRDAKMMEQLEPRVLLATVTWDGGAGTSDWNDAMNWDGDALPGAGDDVVIDVMGMVETITHSTNVSTTVKSITNEENFILSDGTISTTDGWTQNGDMDQTGGTIDGAGDLVLGSSFDWSAGTMQGAGRTFVSSGQTGQIEGNVTLNRTLSNLGTLLWTSGDITLGGVLNNKGTLFTTGDMDINGAGELANNSAFVRQNMGMTESQTNINVEFKNNGQLTVSSGSIKFSKNVAVFSGSIALTSSSARLKIFGPTSSIKSGVSVFGDGALAFQTGVNTIAGTLSNVGEVTVDGGAKLFLNASGSVQDLDLDDAVINAAAALTVNDRFRQFGGTIKSTGSLTIASGASMILNNNGPMFLGLDVTNDGTITLQTGVWRPFNSTITSSGTINLESGSIRTASGSNTITSSGTINKTTSGVVDVFSGQGPTSLSSSGTWNVDAGTLKVSGGGTNSGTLTVDAGAVLQIRDTTYFNTGTITGDGLVSIFTNLNWTSGTISVADFKVNANSALALLDSGTKTVDSSNVNVLGAFNFNAGDLTLTSADFTVRSQAFLSLKSDNAATATSSSVNILSGGTLFKNTSNGGTTDFESNVTLTNGGTVRVDDGTLGFDPASVTNLSSGTLSGGMWDVNDATLDLGTSGTITTLAQGTSVELSGSSTIFLAIQSLETSNGNIFLGDMVTLVVANGASGFTNNGTVEIDNATMQADGNYTSGANSTTIFQIDSMGNVGQIQAVSGTATLGGNLTVDIDGYMPGMTVMHTLVSGSTLTGTFGSEKFMGTPAGFTASINYTNTLAELVLTQN